MIGRRSFGKKGRLQHPILLKAGLQPEEGQNSPTLEPLSHRRTQIPRQVASAPFPAEGRIKGVRFFPAIRLDISSTLIYDQLDLCH